MSLRSCNTNVGVLYRPSFQERHWLVVGTFDPPTGPSTSNLGGHLKQPLGGLWAQRGISYKSPVVESSSRIGPIDKLGSVQVIQNEGDL